MQKISISQKIFSSDKPTFFSCNFGSATLFLPDYEETMKRKIEGNWKKGKGTPCIWICEKTIPILLPRENNVIVRRGVDERKSRNHIKGNVSPDYICLQLVRLTGHKTIDFQIIIQKKLSFIFHMSLKFLCGPRLTFTNSPFLIKTTSVGSSRLLFLFTAYLIALTNQNLFSTFSLFVIGWKYCSLLLWWLEKLSV